MKDIIKTFLGIFGIIFAFAMAFTGFVVFMITCFTGSLWSNLILLFVIAGLAAAIVWDAAKSNKKENKK